MHIVSGFMMISLRQGTVEYLSKLDLKSFKYHPGQNGRDFLWIDRLYEMRYEHKENSNTGI